MHCAPRSRVRPAACQKVSAFTFTVDHTFGFVRRPRECVERMRGLVDACRVLTKAKGRMR